MSKPIRVLIVEDSEDDALLLVRRLARSGFDPAWKRVETAESLHAALGERHGGKVDLLLTDLVMPDGLTGRELAKKMETGESGLRVIYTSGYSPEMRETAFIFREGTNFLQKPYDPHKLAKAVRDCLDA